MKKTPPPSFPKYHRIFHKKGEGVTALQWDGNRQEMSRFCGRHIVQKTFSNKTLVVQTVTGALEPALGEWIVKYPDGSLHLVTDDKFQKQFRRDK